MNPLALELAEIDRQAATVQAKAESVLNTLVALETNRSGPIDGLRELSSSSSDALAACRTMREAIWEASRIKDELDKTDTAKESRLEYRPDPLRERSAELDRLWGALLELESFLDETRPFAESSLMILSGRAGTGKSHLLCDVAKRRVSANLPSILLMGQQFLAPDAPWIQALQHLDLGTYSAEQFVGALDSAAQAPGERALVIIDGINEGEGRRLWPSHLSSFLAQCEVSEWISVVLSVRTSYEHSVIPEELLKRAVRLEHHGFAEHVYEATKTFFDFYGIERPSAPILVPEYDNPLFLKTLCEGLKERKPPRMPKGLQGITETFDGFLKAVNTRLAKQLDYDPAQDLVERSIEAFTSRLADTGQRWLPVDDAKEIVDALLLGRSFEGSLFRGLVSEGVLLREMATVGTPNSEEVVFLAYERLADHLVVRRLLDLHLDSDHPRASFKKGTPLANLLDDSGYVYTGVVEALCVQLPELIGKELPQLVPHVWKSHGFPDAFRQSLIWRKPEAFSKSTFDILNRQMWNDYHFEATLDIILMLAVVPDHPLNANRLHKNLVRFSMPDRDGWWSIFLHRSWGTHSTVDRIVDWAWSVDSTNNLDEDSATLCGITLSWFFTTPNRFLRDGATKALANLLTNRISVCRTLLERFVNVNDPYVAERVFAAVYGSVLRSKATLKLKDIGQFVFDSVFRDGTPPPHILLRDYARGIVEHTLLHQHKLDGELSRIWPPYKSDYPRIPTKKDIAPLMADWSKGSHDSGDHIWSRNRISHSVMNDDFAHYVIGDQLLGGHWLSLRLGRKKWDSPEARLEKLITRFSDAQLNMWNKYKAATEELTRVSWPWNDTLRDVLNLERPKPAQDLAVKKRVANLKRARTRAINQLLNVLGERRRALLLVLLQKVNDGNERRPPGFPSELIQRYIVWRVFDLGWTIERFGAFDRFNIGSHGRDSKKPERIGKKYQWIAYHEGLALVSDHFQFSEDIGQSEANTGYSGPWQTGTRDIDPSCTRRSLKGGTSWSEHKPSWWAPIRHDDWQQNLDARGWIRSTEDLPAIAESMLVTNPHDRSEWINLDCSLTWQQPVPPERERQDTVRRQIWTHLFGYLVRVQEEPTFTNWVKQVDNFGRWMPEIGSSHGMFLGEHPSGAAARFYQNPYYGNSGWTNPGKDCPASLLVPAIWYSSGISSFDCSVDDSFSLHLPSKEIMDLLNLRWSGRDAEYVNAEGRLVTVDPAAHTEGPNAFLLERNELVRVLREHQLAICWVIIGEKQIIQPDLNRTDSPGVLRLSGTCTLDATGERISGFLRCTLQQWDPKKRPAEKLLRTIPVG